MGQTSSHDMLKQATARSESRIGKIAISGRYHRFPKRLEDDYQIEKKVLGSGYNGSVIQAKSIQTGLQYAVKGFKLHGVTKAKQQELEAECEIFLGMDHPHVARLVDVYESEEKLDLVMECMTGGELFKRVSERKRFSEKDGAEATYQMLLAVKYIHTHNVVHRDIKLENFLYESEKSNHLKLIDFGFSKLWKKNTKMELSCGTLAYVAPEVIDQSYTSQCDMWSLGVTVFILLFGYMPFSGSEDQQIRNIKAGKYTVKQDIMNKVSQEAQDFVKSLLVVTPANRMTPDMALEHAWIVTRTGTAEGRQDSSVDLQTVNALVAFGQASLFKRAAMNMMAWSLTNEERSKVRQAFLDMDVNRTGTISIQEFKKVVEDQFHISDEAALQAFQALDSNHTDEIQYSEFLAAMVSSRIAVHDNLLRKTFNRFDTDNSGFITKDNLREVLGDAFEAKEIDKIISEVDESQDGKISYQEFIEYVKGESAAPHHTEGAIRLIENAISQGDGPAEKKMRQKSNPGDAGGKGQGGPPTAPPQKGCCCLL
uniref:Calmodulin n=1 Tax=Alexandrium monilatum TaxID=311494 RepID=A0A7S4PVE9_9DINO|mmetsp:Transcript_11758/g.36897  ORF Transcript_11758/g.36897 Transcript_11758/m.36897 type:complete len:539 (-) Transcript_11758:92-1708(-)|eukprot:CAMPEP_0175515598 /NCGR_PEP_ID=MMETSP0096-20121207/14017_1 /TAXON_ID=311494 /ORGANISM="Alexandrium monilatum, Strain CCMP3105" /LENGTH=538 /DNA_ID=CAMNT_0016817871 /DNA_START=1 /DNA_END=1617 /DNA_ORIENTATION=+